MYLRYNTNLYSYSRSGSVSKNEGSASKTEGSASKNEESIDIPNVKEIVKAQVEELKNAVHSRFVRLESDLIAVKTAKSKPARDEDSKNDEPIDIPNVKEIIKAQVEELKNSVNVRFVR